MPKVPIIGILCVDIANKLKQSYGSEYKSYIAASYVKYIESAGAKVIPIWIGKPEEYYQKILKQINGVLLPGGAVWLNESGGYADAGKYIYKIAVEMNKTGDFFPLWGTCLGYELLLYASINGREPRQDCAAMNDSIPLCLKENFRESRMFKKLPCDLEGILRDDNVTYNYHKYCITKEDFNNFGLICDWRTMSTNQDKNQLEFVSTVEHKIYPFYGVQFHPEKSAYEFEDINICHSEGAIRASQYFSHFFVGECRRSEHKFQDKQEENCHLIYNFPVTFTGLLEHRWVQCYLFKEDCDYSGVH